MAAYVRKVVLGLLVATFIFCFTYSNLTIQVWKGQHAVDMMRRNLKRNEPLINFSEEADCPVIWWNERINSSKYEQKMVEPPPSDSDGNLISPVAVKPLYQNPVLRLRPDYFILPLLQNGPNNQLVGLRETIFIAIKLNRTIVIPKFIKHHTDNRSNPFVSPVHRIQVSDICTFISCVSLQQFRQACGYQIDAILHIRNYKSAHRHQFEKFTGMNLRHNQRKGSDYMAPLLVPVDSFPHGQSSRKFHGPDVTSLFTTNARCVIYPRPLYNLHVAPLKKVNCKNSCRLVETLKDLDILPDNVVLLSVSRHTQNPEYTTKLAEEFVRVKMGGERYVSVHWRYQPHEFMERCNHGTLDNPVKKNICANALRITPQNIAAAIERKIISLQSSAESVDIRHIYFATPSTERDILKEVAITLHRKHGWLTYSSLDLTKFLDKKFRKCPKLRSHYNDILSTTEMQLCAIAVSFLGSQRSSWSDVVHISRKTSKYEYVQQLQDGDIFKMSLDSMVSRSDSVENVPKR